MKVLIISGGSGSQKLQEGFAKINQPVDILVNAYDNGKSTGLVRKVANCLGPSDVRKNHECQARLKYGDNHPNQELIDALSERINVIDIKMALLNVVMELDSYKGLQSSVFLIKKFLMEYVNTTDHMTASDFSIMNAVYAGGAKVTNGDFQKACDILASGFWLIPECVKLNSHTNVYIYAVTESGKLLAEEDIVEWNNANNPIIDIEFHPKRPFISNEAKTLIREADVIIISSGTLWSSIVPTLLTHGVKEEIARRAGDASIFVVMNGGVDADLLGKNSSDVIEILSVTLPMEHVKVLYSSEVRDEAMRIKQIDRDRFRDYAIEADIFDPLSGKHIPDNLVQTIMENV